MKIGITRSTAALIVLLTQVGFAVPQSETQEAKRIVVRRLNYPPPHKFLTFDGMANDSLTTLKSASAVKKLFEKLVIKEEAKAQRESDEIEAIIAKARKFVNKGEAKTKEEAKTLMAGVDFSKEMIVLVRWETGGPPCGTLNWEVKGDGLNFFVLAPDPDVLWKLYRGNRRKALWYGADFFVISRGVSVTFEGQERPWPRP